MARLSTSPVDSLATLRQLKALVVVLVLSNIGLGLVSFYLVRRIDRDYTSLLTGTIPLLNDLQTLTAQSVDAMRGTGSGLAGVAATEWELAMDRSRVAIANDRRLRGTVLRGPWPESLQPACTELALSGEAFTRTATDVLDHFAEGNPTEATRRREAQLRAAFDRYLKSATSAADLLEESSLRTSGALTSQSGRWSAVMLGIASWPLLLLIGLLLLTAIFVLVLLVLFRGRESSS